MPDDAPEAQLPLDRSWSSVGLVAPLVMVHALSRDDVVAVRDLLVTVMGSQGHSPINPERLQLALDGSAAGYLGALAWSPLRTTVTASRPLVGYAQAIRGPEAWDIELFTDPTLSPPPQGSTALEARMLHAVRDALAVEDDTTIRLWRYRATGNDDRLARMAGLFPTREIQQLRRSLPMPSPGSEHGESAAGLALAMETRPFQPGQDEEAWLEVNRRAFAWHPEQGDWTMATLAEREREPWFDPDGFLLYEVEGHLAGFCWTKVHHDTQPPLGEIYVIGVDPRWHGQGLGRALVLAGLNHLTSVGLEVAMLYVEATNEPALRLYESLGFGIHHVDRVYE